jgi:MYXO-CTERM domain-containing protein
MKLMRSRSENGEANVRAARATAWLWLTVPIAVLLVVAAGAELLVDGLFRGDAPNFVAQAVGQDYVTLAVVLPVLVISAVFTGRGSERARLVWLGVLAYVLYTYVIYAFHVRFNPLFLVYVALLGCSLYALIGGLATTDFEAVKARFAQKTPVKATSVFLAVVTALFYFVWLGEVIPALVAGDVPRSVTDAGTPTGSAHVLDMAWMLPAMGLTAYWLWRRRTVAYVLAGVLLAFASLITLAIAAMMVTVRLYDQPVAVEMAAVFASVSAVSLGMLTLYLRGLKEGRSLVPRPARRRRGE